MEVVDAAVAGWVVFDVPAGSHPLVRKGPKAKDQPVGVGPGYATIMALRCGLLSLNERCGCIRSMLGASLRWIGYLATELKIGTSFREMMAVSPCWLTNKTVRLR